MGKQQAVEKACEITNAKITFVSLVDAAANRKQFLVTRGKDGQAEIKLTGRILRQDGEKHLVTGIVYEPMAEDTWGTFMNAEEIEKAAHWFMRNGSLNNDIQHSFEPNRDCTVVESWIARSDTEIGGEAVKQGTWLMTVEVTDPEIWRAIEDGKITGLSMGGVGTYSEEDTDLGEVEKSETVQEKRGLLKRFAEFLGLNLVERGEVEELYNERMKEDSFWNAFNALECSLRKWDYRDDKYIYETDEGKIRDALTDFESILSNILTSEQPIAMAIKGPETIEKSKDKEEREVTKAEIEAAIEKAATLAVEKLTRADGGEAPAENAGAAAENAPGESGQAEQGATETQADGGSEGGQESAPAADAPLTRADVEEIVTAAIEKATAAKADAVTAEQVEEMVQRSVEKAVEPVLKHVGVPSNMGGDGIERSEGQHYLHGIL